jgi:hypothetical protein
MQGDIACHGDCIRNIHKKCYRGAYFSVLVEHLMWGTLMHRVIQYFYLSNIWCHFVPKLLCIEEWFVNWYRALILLWSFPKILKLGTLTYFTWYWRKKEAFFCLFDFCLFGWLSHIDQENWKSSIWALWRILHDIEEEAFFCLFDFWLVESYWSMIWIQRFQM